MENITERKNHIDKIIKKNQNFVSLIDLDVNNLDSEDTRIYLKKQFLDFLDTMTGVIGDSRLEYAKSGATGHIFNDKANLFSVKFSPFPKNSDYGDIYNIKRPENAEIKIIKLLSELVIKGKTPHITLPIVCFDTNASIFITDEITDVVGNSKKYWEFMDNYKIFNKYYDIGSILISEFASEGDLQDFLLKYYEKKSFTLTYWRAIFFQILSTLASIHSKYPSFRHNDLKPDNILVHKISLDLTKFSYRVEKKKYVLPNIGYQIRLWDFDFSSISGIADNNKLGLSWTNELNLTSKQHRYIDVHYLFTKLTKLLKIDESKFIPQEVKDFIGRVLPEKYRNDRGRLMVDDEYTTPLMIIETDPFFEPFRVSQK